MKLVTRNSKFETSSKLEIGLLFPRSRFANKPNVPTGPFRIPLVCDSTFEFVSNFEFRISNFPS
jgi:hypothetical protein